jgi:hypothetical protein
MTADDRESFDFLIGLDPLFTLRFNEEGALHVNVVAAGVDGRLSLTADQAETAEPASTRQLP